MHPTYNHRALFPALAALPYIEDVQTTTEHLDTGTPVIEMTLSTNDPPGSLFNDVQRLAERHQVVRTAHVSTILSVDRDERRAFLTPA